MNIHAPIPPDLPPHLGHLRSHWPDNPTLPSRAPHWSAADHRSVSRHTRIYHLAEREATMARIRASLYE